MVKKFWKYGKIIFTRSSRGWYRTDSSILAAGIIVNQLSFIYEISAMTDPTIKAVPANANRTPSSLLSHPNITSENSFSMSLDRMLAKSITATMIIAKDMILMTASLALIHWAT